MLGWGSLIKTLYHLIGGHRWAHCRIWHPTNSLPHWFFPLKRSSIDQDSTQLREIETTSSNCILNLICVDLPGNTLDQAMENLKVSKPISFIRATSPCNIIYFNHFLRRKRILIYSLFQKVFTEAEYLIEIIKLIGYISSTMIWNFFCHNVEKCIYVVSELIIELSWIA